MAAARIQAWRGGGQTARRNRIALGLLLSATAGLVFGYAWSGHDHPYWWVGALTFLSGILFVLSGVYTHEAAWDAPALGAAKGAPVDIAADSYRLGDLLVHRYRLLTERELSGALGRQRGTLRPLGDVLVELGLLTEEELARVLQAERATQETQTQEAATRHSQLWLFSQDDAAHPAAPEA
jgi:hypothetical protein